MVPCNVKCYTVLVLAMFEARFFPIPSALRTGERHVHFDRQRYRHNHEPQP